MSEIACKAQGMQLVLIAFLRHFRTTRIGEIASARFQSVARRAQYLFRERSVKLKSSACLLLLEVEGTNGQGVTVVSSGGSRGGSWGAMEPPFQHSASKLHP